MANVIDIESLDTLYREVFHEEQRFFRLEMAEEAAGAKGSRSWLYKLYSIISDYSFSITRPAILLTTNLAAMMLISGGLSYLNHCLPDSNVCSFSTEGLMSIGVTVAVILHKVISLLALFLMGLALRNLFKLK